MNIETPRVLVVDDNPLNVELARAVLAADGFDVRSAQDAVGAAVCIGQFAPHLILMDIQMPDMDGLAFTRQLKADAATRHIVVLAFTAHAMKGDEARMLQAGCDGYLSKPIHIKTFAATVRAHLGATRRLPTMTDTPPRPQGFSTRPAINRWPMWRGTKPQPAPASSASWPPRWPTSAPNGCGRCTRRTTHPHPTPAAAICTRVPADWCGATGPGGCPARGQAPRPPFAVARRHGRGAASGRRAAHHASRCDAGCVLMYARGRNVQPARRTFNAGDFEHEQQA